METKPVRRLTDCPMCPYCGFPDEGWWEGLPQKNDGETWSMECPYCEKQYYIQLNVSHRFATYPMEGN